MSNRPWSGEPFKSSVDDTDSFLGIDSGVSDNARYTAAVLKGYMQTPWVNNVNANNQILSGLLHLVFVPTASTISNTSFGIRASTSGNDSLILQVGSNDAEFSLKFAANNDVHTFSLTTFTTPNIVIDANGSLRLGAGTVDPSQNGEFVLNVNDVIIQSGGIDVNLTNVLTSAIESINGDSTAAQLITGVTNEIDIDNVTAGTTNIGAGSNIPRLDGTQTFTGINTFTENITIEKDNTSPPLFIATLYDTTDGSFTGVRGNRAKGTKASPLPVDDTTVLFDWDVYGWDGSGFVFGGGIGFSASGTWSATSRPLKFEVLTTVVGATLEEIRLVVRDDGTTSFENNPTINIKATEYADNSTQAVGVIATNITGLLDTALFVQTESSGWPASSSLAGLYLNPLRTKLFIADTVFEAIREYTLSTPGDLSTKSLTNTFSTGLLAARDVFFNNDGTIMYVINGGAPNSIIQYSLGGNSFSLNSVTQTGELFLDTIDDDVESGWMSPSGKHLLFTGDEHNRVYGLNLDTVDDVESADLSSLTQVGVGFTSPSSISASSDGRTLYISSFLNPQTITQFHVDSVLAWDMTTIRVVTTFEPPISFTFASFVTPDNAEMYTSTFSSVSKFDLGLSSTGNSLLTNITSVTITTSSINTTSITADLILIKDDDESNTYTILGGALTANFSVIFPSITANDTFALLGVDNLFTGVNTFRDFLVLVGSTAQIIAQTFIVTPESASEFIGQRANGTEAIPLPLELDDNITRFVADGFTGVQFKEGGKFGFIADGLWSATSFPTRFELTTTPVNGTVPVTNLEVSSDGILLSRGIEVSRIPVLGNEIFSQADLPDSVPGGIGIFSLSGTLTGYEPNGEDVTFSGGDGTGITGTAIIDGAGEIQSISITNGGGTGYTVGNDIAIEGVTSGTTTAILDVDSIVDVITISEGQFNYMDNIVFDSNTVLAFEAGNTKVFEGMRESNTLLTFSGTNIGDVVRTIGNVSDLTFRNIRFDLSGCTNVQWFNGDVSFFGWFNSTVSFPFGGGNGTAKIATIRSSQTIIIDNDVAVLFYKEGITVNEVSPGVPSNNIRSANFFALSHFSETAGSPVWEINSLGQNAIFTNNNYILNDASESIFDIDPAIIAPIVIEDTNLSSVVGDFFTPGGLNETDLPITSDNNVGAADSMTIGGWFVNSNANLITFTVLDQFEDFNFAGGTLLPYFENERLIITDSTIGEFTYIGFRTVTASITGVLSADTNDAQDRIFAFKGQIDRGSGYDDFDTPIITTVEIKKDTTQAVFTQEVILNTGDKIKYQMAQTAGGLISVLITSGTINIRA